MEKFFQGFEKRASAKHTQEYAVKGLGRGALIGGGLGGILGSALGAGGGPAAVIPLAALGAIEGAAKGGLLGGGLGAGLGALRDSAEIDMLEDAKRRRLKRKMADAIEEDEE